MIKHIIFDLGGVIIKHSQTINEDILTQIFGISLEQATNDWNKLKGKLIMGKLNSLDFITQLRAKYHQKTSLEELHRLWIYLYEKEARDIDKILLAAVDELIKTYPVYLFTDTLDSHDAFNLKRGIYEHFTAVFKSHDLGVTKNDVKSFQMVLDRINANPEECLFIDDSPKHIATAIKLGFKTVLYTQRKESLPEILNIITS